MPIKEFHLDRVLRGLEMTHEQVDSEFILYVLFLNLSDCVKNF